MGYWPWWLGAIALAAVPVVHWLLLHRNFAVSGRYTSLTDRLRGRAPAPSQAMTGDEMIEALRAATLAEFGDCTTEAPPALAAGGDLPVTVAAAAPQGPSAHLAFLGCVVAGGALSSWLRGGFATAPWPGFTHVFGANPVVLGLVLVGGGLLVGFGTRMAGGCTSGHGLCGVSRLQPGSLVTTASFFGAGILVSLLLGRLG